MQPSQCSEDLPYTTRNAISFDSFRLRGPAECIVLTRMMTSREWVARRRDAKVVGEIWLHDKQSPVVLNKRKPRLCSLSEE